MRGRPIGCTKVKMDSIERIIKMTKEGKSRPEIAKTLGLCTSTIWRYQKVYS